MYICEALEAVVPLVVSTPVLAPAPITPGVSSISFSARRVTSSVLASEAPGGSTSDTRR